MKPNENQPQCDGTQDAAPYTEHPRVYLAWDAEGHAQCPYCGKKFTKKDDH